MSFGFTHLFTTVCYEILRLKMVLSTQYQEDMLCVDRIFEILYQIWKQKRTSLFFITPRRPLKCVEVSELLNAVDPVIFSFTSFFQNWKKTIQIIAFHVTQCVADLSINCWNFFCSANQIHLKWNLAEDETTNWSNNEFGTEEEDHWKTAFLSSSPRLSLSEPYGFTF